MTLYAYQITDVVGIEDSNFPLMRHTFRITNRLYLGDTAVSTRVFSTEPTGPAIYVRTAMDGLDLTDRLLRGISRLFTEEAHATDWQAEWWNGVKRRQATDYLRLRDGWFRPRDYVYALTDYLTLTDSQSNLGNVWYTGRGLVDLLGRADTWRDIVVDGAGRVELLGAAGTWRDYGMDGRGIVGLLGPARYRKVDLTVTGVPDGWAAQVTLPDATVAATAPSSMGRAVLDLDVPDTVTSGTLTIFTNSAATARAPFGSVPLTGYETFKRSNVWGYHASPYWLTDVAQSVYIERPFGGWTTVGSTRVDREEIGYATYTDSALGGLSRGDHDTLATSHGGPPPDLVVHVKSGGGLLDVTSYLAYTNSVAWLQDSIPIFANSYDELYIGAASRFSAVHFALARNASERLLLTPYYSAGESAWVAWTGSAMLLPLDTTSGFTWSGEAALEPCGDWAAMPVLDATSRFWFRLVRNTGSRDLVVPRLMGVTITADTVITKRLSQPYLYYLTPQDSGQMIYFKAMARGLLGTAVEGEHAPVTVVDLGR